MPVEESTLKFNEDNIEGTLSNRDALVCRFHRWGDRTFSGGKYQDECRLYEIATAKYLGSFPLNVQLERGRRSLASALGEDVTVKAKAAVSPVGGSLRLVQLLVEELTKVGD